MRQSETLIKERSRKEKCESMLLEIIFLSVVNTRDMAVDVQTSFYGYRSFVL
jgi:hypothetical protein